MAQVNVDLSEYDMLRQSKDKAEKEVSELKEEIKKLKDNASNVVVKNRYYIASIDYKSGACKIINDLGYEGLTKLIDYSQQMHWSAKNDPFGRPCINPELINRVAFILERNLKDLLNLRSGFIEDTTTIEVRGFDEISETIKHQIEEKYKISMEEKMQSLDRERESYNLKHLDVDKAVNKAEEDLKRIYDKEIALKDEKIDALKDMWQTISNSNPLPKFKEVLAFNKEWIEADWNPTGIRIGYLGEMGFVSAVYDPDSEGYGACFEEGDDYDISQNDKNNVKHTFYNNGDERGDIEGYRPNMPTHFMEIPNPEFRFGVSNGSLNR